MPVHLLLLLLLSVRSECLTVGKNIKGVFPENIAYYHPSPTQNKLHITALYNGTKVKLVPSSMQPYNLDSGEVMELDSVQAMELDKTNISTKVVTLESNEDIAVEILSHRNNSVQTALLLPTDQLGEVYQIPPIPHHYGSNLYGSTGTITVTERSPYKLIIANTDSLNTITLPDGGSVQLNANEVVQIWVYENMVNRMVNGTKPFLALFAHSCAVQFGCTCGVLYTPLRPYNGTELTFIVPPVFAEDATSETYLLKPSGAQQLQAATSGRVVVSGQVLLQKPGLLMNLIPEEEFGSCFAVRRVANAAENWAVIVALADSTEGVQIGNSPAEVTWEPVPGTKYESAIIKVNDTITIIWHKFKLIAVYFVGKKVQDKDAWFGNPAPRLSKDPDYRGCVLEPEIKEVHLQEGSWQESIRACRSKGLDLISLSDQILQKQIYNWTMGLNLNLTELWMGLRKCSYTGLWYWISEDPLIHMDWSKGSLGNPHQGECGQISLKDFDSPCWIQHNCCKAAKALCYKPPKLLTI